MSSEKKESFLEKVIAGILIAVIPVIILYYLGFDGKSEDDLANREVITDTIVVIKEVEKPVSSGNSISFEDETVVERSSDYMEDNDNVESTEDLYDIKYDRVSTESYNNQNRSSELDSSFRQIETEEKRVNKYAYVSSVNYGSVQYYYSPTGGVGTKGNLDSGVRIEIIDSAGLGLKKMYEFRFQGQTGWIFAKNTKK